jgi:hypothetical protein
MVTMVTFLAYPMLLIIVNNFLPAHIPPIRNRCTAAAFLLKQTGTLPGRKSTSASKNNLSSD